jgi:hydrogenase-4 component E
MNVSLLMIVTSFVAVEWRHLSAAAYTYQVQSVLIVLIFAFYAHSLHNPALYEWAATALVSKAILVPWLLRRYVVKIHPVEVEPIFDTITSQVVGFALASFAFWWVFTHHAQLVVLPSMAGEPFRMNLAVAAVILVISFYALLTRRDAFKVVIGLCLLENAVHLSLVSLVPSIPETAMIGVVTDVVVSVWLLLYIVADIHRTTGSVDTSNLQKLRG